MLSVETMSVYVHDISLDKNTVYWDYDQVRLIPATEARK